MRAPNSSAVPESVRSPRKVLRIVGELHLRGYQRIRIVTHAHGTRRWRCGVTRASKTFVDNGLVPLSWDPAVLPQYLSGPMRDYFTWTDARHATPSSLADLFVARCSAIASAGAGQDWEYAGWCSWLLHLIYPDVLPAATNPDDAIRCRLGPVFGEPTFPLPPARR